MHVLYFVVVMVVVFICLVVLGGGGGGRGLYFFFVCLFFGHCSPSTDSRRVLVSFSQKNVHRYWLTT